MTEQPHYPAEIQEVLEDLDAYPLFSTLKEARAELSSTDQRKQDIFNALRKGEISLEQAREAMQQLKALEG